MNDLERFKNPQNFEALSMVNLKLTLTLMILLQNEENITVGNPQNYWGLTWSYFIWHHTHPSSCTHLDRVLVLQDVHAIYYV